jgi:hypothetical protein
MLYGLVLISPSVVSEATAEEKLVAGSGLRRSLLIQRLEGSRSRVRRTRGAMGIESILVSKALPDEDFCQKSFRDREPNCKNSQSEFVP